ncbi:MAG: winged helix-turn-helix domain-containing protein [Campylobacterota bacterium]|nr:winged helix-turn-helix domain-containing protein [Campylobacterota bacterium]
MIKKLRKFSNTTILCIMDDEKLKSVIKNKLDNCKEFICLQETNRNLEDIDFDILLIDQSYNAFAEIMQKIKIQKPLLPKIVILNDKTEQNIVECINSGAYSILSNPLHLEDLELSIVMALNQSKRVDKICLDDNIYYDSYRERFYNDSGAIAFTKFEFQVLKLLLDNSNKIIGYDEIKEKVWKEKKMSIFTMRNVINKIRNKTYYNIIRNNSSSGYQIDKIQ